MKNFLRIVAVILCLAMMLPLGSFARTEEIPEDLWEEMKENISSSDLHHLGLYWEEDLALEEYYGEIGGYHMGKFQVKLFAFQVITEIVIRNHVFTFSDSTDSYGLFAYKDGIFSFYDDSKGNRFKRIINNLSEEDFLKFADAARGEYIPSDVTYKEWYGTAVKQCIRNGYMTGIGNNRFDPLGTITREQVIQILYNFENDNKDVYNGETGFIDVPGGQWYSRAVKWAKDQGITNGIGNGKFGLGKKITREEMAVLIKNYSELKGMDTSATADITKYDDADFVSSWAIEAMQWCNATSIIKGDKNNCLNPLSNASRAEVAQIVINYKDYTFRH